MQAHRSPRDLGSEQWQYPDAVNPQMQYGRGEADSNSYFHQSSPHMGEDCFESPPPTGFQTGFADTRTLARDGTQPESFHNNSPQDMFANGGSYQRGSYQGSFLPRDSFPPSPFSLNSLPQDGIPITPTHQGLGLEIPWNGFVQEDFPGQDTPFQMPPPAETIGKRKRNDVASDGAMKEERVIKRARSNNIAPAYVPDIPLTAPHGLGYGMSQLDSQVASVPQISNVSPDSFPNHFSTAYNGYGYGQISPYGSQGAISPADSHYSAATGAGAASLNDGTFFDPQDPTILTPETPNARGHVMDQPESCNYTQWQADQVVPQMGLDLDWLT